MTNEHPGVPGAAADPVAVPPPVARHNPLRTRADWQAARDAAMRDPGVFHGAIARRELHWFDPALGPGGAWIRFEPDAGCWQGFDGETGTPVEVPYAPDHEPWTRAFDDREAPFYRWFAGGLTNACFNEIDRHVLAGHGAEPALLFEGDRWDQSLDAGRGGPVVSYAVSRRQLLLEVAKCALALRRLGLQPGDRVAINMPNIPEQLYWTEACKRLGVVYTPVFGGFSDKTLSDRIHDAGARVVVTADGGYRNAQVVAFKEAYTDPALDGYVPAEIALATIERALDALGSLQPAVRAAIVAGSQAAVRGEITLERSDLMRGIGRALESMVDLDAVQASRIRIAIASALVATPPRVETVVVVRHAGAADLSWRPERDRWAHELTDQALRAHQRGGQAQGRQQRQHRHRFRRRGDGGSNSRRAHRHRFRPGAHGRRRRGAPGRERARDRRVRAGHAEHDRQGRRPHLRHQLRPPRVRREHGRGQP